MGTYIIAQGPNTQLMVSCSIACIPNEWA